MKLVIDANIIISALIKDGLHRALIISDKFNLISPDYIVGEVEKYIPYIAKKAKLDVFDIELIFALIFQHITVIPKTEYEDYLNTKESKSIDDSKDIPYIACYLATKSDGIWSNDGDFKITNEKISIYTTEKLLEVLRR